MQNYRSFRDNRGRDRGGEETERKRRGRGRKREGVSLDTGDPWTSLKMTQIPPKNCYKWKISQINSYQIPYNTMQKDEDGRCERHYVTGYAEH